MKRREDRLEEIILWYFTRMSAELEQWRKENVSKGLVESMGGGDVGNGSAPVRGKVDLILMKYGGG